MGYAVYVNGELQMICVRKSTADKLQAKYQQAGFRVTVKYEDIMQSWEATA